jgi:O-antigen/teichoic acid export membrane protein
MFLLGQLGMQILALGLALVSLRPTLLRRADSALLRTSLAYALPLVPAVLGTFVLTSSDRFIVQDLLGPSELARYQIAYNIGSMPLLLIGVLSNVWLPRIFALERASERAAVLARSRDGLYALLIPVVLGLSIGSPLVLRIWAPPEYRPDELLLVTALVIVAVLPYTAGMTATRALLAQGATRWIAGMTLVAALANVLLNLILVPRYELVGSALATLLAYLLLQRLLVSRTRSLTPFPPTPPARVLVLMGVALVALLASELPTSGLGLILRSFAVLAAVASFAWQMWSITTAGARGRRREQTRVPTEPALAVTPDSARHP